MNDRSPRRGVARRWPRVGRDDRDDGRGGGRRGACRADRARHDAPAVHRRRAAPSSATSSSAGTTSWRRRWRSAPPAWSTTACCPVGLPGALAGALEAAESEQRPGITGREARLEPQAALARIVTDLNAFRTRHDLSRVVVVNVSSTEAPVEPHPAHEDPRRADGRAGPRTSAILPPSALYALAAIETGCAFVDFTPSVGARLPAIEALAEAHEVPLAGSDGKTGETFMKSALAPAFAARALKVRSWSGMNILGGGDGAALADPARAQSKLDSKGRLLEEILGYPVEAPIHIEDVRDMGEWKTAWDHIVFEGFLGMRMKLQFTWEGCDSRARRAAAARPDPAGGARARARRGAACWPNLAFFFKDPAGTQRAPAPPPVRDAGALGAPEGRRVMLPAPADVAELVRLPAVLSVPGDVLVGAAASGQVRERAAHRRAGRRVVVPVPGRDGAQRLRRPRGRRGRAAGAADPVGPRVAGVRARARRRADRRRGRARGRRRRRARAGRRSRRWPPRSGATTSR